MPSCCKAPAIRHTKVLVQHVTENIIGEYVIVLHDIKQVSTYIILKNVIQSNSILCHNIGV